MLITSCRIAQLTGRHAHTLKSRMPDTIFVARREIVQDPITPAGERIIGVDGGFCANNPALDAIVDATEAFKIARQNIRLLDGPDRNPSVGHKPGARVFPYRLRR